MGRGGQEGFRALRAEVSASAERAHQDNPPQPPQRNGGRQERLATDMIPRLGPDQFLIAPDSPFRSARVTSSPSLVESADEPGLASATLAAVMLAGEWGRHRRAITLARKMVK
jgi:hypothetical protein